MPRAPVQMQGADQLEDPALAASSSYRFDLTSAAGLATVAAFLVRGVTSAAAIAPATPIAVPIFALLAFYELKRRGSRVRPANESSRSARVTTSVQEEQQAVAVTILKKGRELGLSEIEIILEGDVGVDTGIRLPKALNVDLLLKAGRSTKTTIRAKYRDAHQLRQRQS